MKKSNNKYALVYLALIISVASIPFFNMSKLDTYKNALQTSMDIARTVAILIGSLLAINYFDPFGISKKRKERQYENVIKILELFIGLRINLKVPNGGAAILITKTEVNRILFEKDEFFSKIFDYPIVFDFDNYREKLEQFSTIKNSLFTPKEISSAMSFLEIKVASGYKSSDKDYALIFFGKYQQYEDLCTKLNNEEYTFKNYFLCCHNLIRACEKWCKKNSFSIHEFNLG